MTHRVEKSDPAAFDTLARTATEEMAQVLPAELAAAFVAQRKMLKKPMTGYAGALMAKKLRTEFPDLAAAIAATERSILNGWTDIYPPSTAVIRNERIPAESTLDRRKRELAERITNDAGSTGQGSDHSDIPRQLSFIQSDGRLH